MRLQVCSLPELGSERGPVTQCPSTLDQESRISSSEQLGHVERSHGGLGGNQY